MAGKELIARVLPQYKDDFILEIIPGENGKDVFEIEADKTNKIILRGNSSNSLATAFNWYLRYYVHISYDWQAVKSLDYAGKLPLPNEKERHVNLAKERFFNNVCTFGYTFPWWQWDRWERFIDWLAMNGINRPLMLGGQEAVWLRVWRSYGMKTEEICSYFSGPAHLPWHRMANLDEWGSPLPIGYIEGQRKLQQKIVERARLLGMKPILSAFSGHVPEKIKTLKPNAKITQIAPGWGGMDSVYATWFLDPGESLFIEIQGRFIKEQSELYGTDNLYSADPFNEITPPSWEPEYLAKVTKTIYESMAIADPKAVWYQMSWIFYDQKKWTEPGRLSAMINAVPKGKLAFLDYVCEEFEFYKSTENFYGAPFIWCYLGNFGGNTDIVAPINKVSNRINKVLPIANCIGIGSTLEGINVNPEIFEMCMETPWMNNGKIDISNWIQDYAARRAGYKDTAVMSAWTMMADKILADSAVSIWTHKVVLQSVPTTEIVLNTSNYSFPNIPYKNADLASVLQKLLNAGTESRNSDGYQYDLVNIARQVLGNYSSELQKQMALAYKAKDINTFHHTSEKFIQLGKDVDTLLASRHEFLLGKWVQDARMWGTTMDEKNGYEKNARQILTTWHKAGGSLTDYSNRQWNGMFGSYYMPRWEEFTKRVEKSLTDGQPFNNDEFYQWRCNFENKWTETNNSNFITVPQGDPYQTVLKYFTKYRSEIL
jgi:alpha-N-acetylglucosaminidase